MDEKAAKRARVIPNFEQTAEICNKYNLGGLIDITEKIENTSNVNLKIQTKKGKFVIRIFPGDPQRLNFIMDVLKNLDNNDIPVLMPLRNIEGGYFYKFHTKNIQVTRFRNGKAFAHNPKQAAASGKILRRFHDVLAQTPELVRPRGSIYPSTNIIRESISKIQHAPKNIPAEHIKLITSLYDQIVEKWEAHKQPLPNTIIHGDWHQGNLQYSDMDEVSCIMDFDFITRAERIFDIAYALWRFRIYKESQNLGKSFLEGYGRLSPQEIEILPLEIARINYFFICSSALTRNPIEEVNRQIELQYPFITWALSKDGEKAIKSLCERR